MAEDRVRGSPARWNRAVVEIRSNDQPQIYLMDESEGLPDIPGWTCPSRPADTVSSGDFTWVKKLYA